MIGGRGSVGGWSVVVVGGRSCRSCYIIDVVATCFLAFSQGYLSGIHI